MKLYESINRGFNLLAVSIIGLSGFAFMPEIFGEHDWDDKADDILLFLLGIAAIIWYRKNKFKSSMAPVVFVALALITYIPDLSLGLVQLLGYADLPVFRR